MQFSIMFLHDRLLVVAFNKQALYVGPLRLLGALLGAIGMGFIASFLKFQDLGITGFGIGLVVVSAFLFIFAQQLKFRHDRRSQNKLEEEIKLISDSSDQVAFNKTIDSVLSWDNNNYQIMYDKIYSIRLEEVGQDDFINRKLSGDESIIGDLHIGYSREKHDSFGSPTKDLDLWILAGQDIAMCENLFRKNLDQKVEFVINRPSRGK
jgi:hypothetical protein